MENSALSVRKWKAYYSIKIAPIMCCDASNLEYAVYVKAANIHAALQYAEDEVFKIIQCLINAGIRKISWEITDVCLVSDSDSEVSR